MAPAQQQVNRRGFAIGPLLILIAIGVALLAATGVVSATVVKSFNDRSLTTYTNEEYSFSFLHPKSAPLKVVERDTALGKEVRFYDDWQQSDSQFNSVGRDEAVGISSVSGEFYKYERLNYLYDDKEDYFDEIRNYYESSEGQSRMQEIKIEYRKLANYDAMTIRSEYTSSFNKQYRDTNAYIFGKNFTFEIQISDSSGRQVDDQVKRILESIKLPQ